jgi:Protein of unknown function (DUF3606)
MRLAAIRCAMRRPSKPRNRSIDDQDHELTYWSEKLGVSRDRLREAVAKVGSMRKAVEQQQRQPGYAEAE